MARDVRRVDGARRAGGAERALVELALLVPREDATPSLELVDVAGRLAGEDLDRVLVAEVVGALDGVERVGLRVVVRLVAERRVDASLGRAGVAARRMELRDDGDACARVVGLDRGAHAGAAGTDDEHVEGSVHRLEPIGLRARVTHVSLSRRCSGATRARRAERRRSWTRAARQHRGSAEAARGPAAATAGSTSAANFARSSRGTSRRAPRLRVVRGGVGPGRARIEQRRVDARHGDRDLEAEDRVDAVLDVVERRRTALRVSSARVALIGMRCPSPNGPPVQPVLTSQTLAPCSVELVREHPRVDGRAAAA